jgi:hypothetical protein
MLNQIAHPLTFDRSIETTVKEKVRIGRLASSRERASIIEYLRDLEAAACHEGQDPNVLQIIQSGRRLLGDS